MKRRIQFSDVMRRNLQDSKMLRASDVQSMISKIYMHSRNHRLYEVTDIIWNGVTDEWDVLHRTITADSHPVQFTRSLTNFNGVFEGTEQRRFIGVVK